MRGRYCGCTVVEVLRLKQLMRTCPGWARKEEEEAQVECKLKVVRVEWRSESTLGAVVVHMDQHAESPDIARKQIELACGFRRVAPVAEQAEVAAGQKIDTMMTMMIHKYQP